MRSISHTEISTALTCQAQHAFKYTGRLSGGDTLKPKGIKPILSEGRAWGAMIAAYHASEPGMVAMVTAGDAMRASLNADFDRMREQGALMEGVGGQQVEMEARLAAIFVHYCQLAEPFDNLSMIEEELLVPIPSRSGGKRGSSRYKFQAFLDGFTIDPATGFEWLVEEKLRGRLTSHSMLELGRQFLYYAWSRQRQTGRRVVGVIVEERLNAVPKPPRIVQTGKEDPLKYECPSCSAGVGNPCCRVPKRGWPRTSMAGFHAERRSLCQQTYGPSHAVDQMTTVPMYLATCEQYRVEPQQETLQALGERKWQQRYAITFRPSELAEAGRELVSAAQMIRDLDGGRYPLRNARPQICGSCDFKGICKNPGDRLFVDLQFERTVPKRLRPPREPEPVGANPNGMEMPTEVF